MAVANKGLLAVTAMLISFAAGAVEDGYSAAYSDCMDASGGVTADMLGCIYGEHETQDARLNQNYKIAMQVLETAQQKQLRDAQRLWIKFRDANCNLLGSLSGGTLDQINAASCLLDMTKERAEVLARLANQGR